MDQKQNTKKGIIDLYRNKKIVKNYEKIRFTTLLGVTIDKSEEIVLTEIFKNKKNRITLEVACGTGRITKKMPKKVISLDSSKEMIKNAKKRVKDREKHFVVGDAFLLPFKTKFSCAISFRFLRHLKKNEQKLVFEQIKSVLKKDGIFIFDVLNENRSAVGKFLERVFLAGRWIKSKLKGEAMVTVYDDFSSLKKIKNFVNQNGFEIVKAYPICQDYGLMFFLHLLEKAKCLILPPQIRSKIISREIKKLKNEKAKNNLEWVIVAKRQ